MTTQMLGAVVRLCNGVSPYDRYTIADIHRLFLPPIVCDQCWEFVSAGITAGFVSWALFDDERAQAFLKQRPILPEDWRSGDQLWVIDWIAPHVPVAQMAQMGRFLRAVWRERYPDIDELYFTRSNQPHQLRSFKRKARITDGQQR